MQERTSIGVDIHKGCEFGGMTVQLAVELFGDMFAEQFRKGHATQRHPAQNPHHGPEDQPRTKAFPDPLHCQPIR